MYHRHITEALLAEGDEVVAKIKNVSAHPYLFEDLDAVRDRLGKKANCIWLQAQVYATMDLADAIREAKKS